VGRKRKVSKAVLEKQKAAAKKKAKKQDDDDYDDEEDDAYNKFSIRWENKSANPKPPVGSLEKCAKCSKQFTVVRVSVVVYLPSGLHSSEDEIHGCCESSPRPSLPSLHQGLWN
jgi:DNA repair protein RAD7